MLWGCVLRPVPAIELVSSPFFDTYTILFAFCSAGVPRTKMVLTGIWHDWIGVAILSYLNLLRLRSSLNSGIVEHEDTAPVEN